MDLNPFFQAKVGQSLRMTATTGNDLFTEVYARQYQLELVACEGGEVMFTVRSCDIVPSGYQAGGADKQFPSATVPVGVTVEATIQSAIEVVDPDFRTRYPTVTWS